VNLARIPRIPAPITDRIPAPIINSPQIRVPVTEYLRPPVVDIPSFEQPSYEPPNIDQKPLVPVPGSDSSEEEEEETEEDGRELPDGVLPDPTIGRPVIEVPIVGQIPLPTTSEVGLAGTTAVAATAATLIGKSLVETLVKRMKPAVKTIMLKIKDASGKRFTDYEVQQYFEFEGQKSVAKLLKAEQKDSKKLQLEEHLQQQHQNKRWRKASRGGNKSPAVQPDHSEEV